MSEDFDAIQFGFKLLNEISATIVDEAVKHDFVTLKKDLPNGDKQGIAVKYFYTNSEGREVLNVTVRALDDDIGPVSNHLIRKYGLVRDPELVKKVIAGYGAHPDPHVKPYVVKLFDDLLSSGFDLGALPYRVVDKTATIHDIINIAGKRRTFFNVLCFSHPVLDIIVTLVVRPLIKTKEGFVSQSPLPKGRGL